MVTETLRCRHCKQPVEMLTDPWEKPLHYVHVGQADWSWEGESEGWRGTNGEKCQGDRDTVAEVMGEVGDGGIDE